MPLFSLTATLSEGTEVPRLGLGTWKMGEQPASARGEVAALQLGIDLGMTLIDTAEMYGEGGAEQIVAQAIRGRRDRVFIVSKFYPHNASRRRLPEACEASLRRLGIDAIDLYLLHWRGDVPLGETVDALGKLTAAGKIRRWGVSNFDVGDLEELAAVRGAGAVVANQVLYNLSRRGIEFDLLPWSRRRKLATMAYSPIEQGRLAGHRGLEILARRLGATPAQVALAWLLRGPDIVAIPKAADERHVRANHDAQGLALDSQAISELDRLFPPPRGKRALEMI
jgi:diketogulonate reductase-like aldo/keto reductase